MKRYFIQLFTAIAIGFVSCGDGDLIVENNSQQNNNSGSSGKTYEEEIWEIVQKNTSVSVYYEKYAWHIIIDSQLCQLYPQANVRFGHACSYGEGIVYTCYFDKDLDDGWGVYIDVNSNKTHYKIDTSIFVDAGPYGAACVCFKSYLALEEKLSNGEKLSNEERNLYNSCVEILEETEREIMYTYEGCIFVEYDGIEFLQFNLKDLNLWEVM